ncbi:MAG: hypothetical protein OXU79_09775 [Gemmatimonadota bacterium]|nr:hypothetical protein [Gemmatimonadota bacterium]
MNSAAAAQPPFSPDSVSGGHRLNTSTNWRILVVIVSFLIGGVRASAGTPPDLSPVPRITEAELFNRAAAIFRPDLLPAESPYFHERAVCGTPVIMALAARWPGLSEETHQAFAQVFQRPATTDSLVSPGGRFRVHYDTRGRHSVSTVDANRNRVPDYVEEVAATFDAVWSLQVRNLGYRDPLDDGDGLFDVYIRQLGTSGVYGQTFPNSLRVPVTSAYLTVDNDYTDRIYATRGLDGLHVTVAHEFFHAIQFAYNARDLTWWHEATATWMEDVAYDDVNDYFQYTRFVLDSPTVALDWQPNLQDGHQYGACIYAHYLDQVFGRRTIRETWEGLGERNTTSYDIGKLSPSVPTGGFAGTLPGYVVWNYFTGTRSRDGFYEEGVFYQPAASVRTVSMGSGGQASGTGTVDHLAADYVQVVTEGLRGGLRADFSLAGEGSWQFWAMLIDTDGVGMLRPVRSRLEIPNAGQYDQIVFLPISDALEGQDFDYEYSISAVESVDGETRPLRLTVGESRLPVVRLGVHADRATVRADGAEGRPVTWNVARASGSRAINVTGQAESSSFTTATDSIEIAAVGTGTTVVQVSATGAGTTPSVAWAVFGQTLTGNLPPVVAAISDTTIAEGQTLSILVNAEDEDGDALAFSSGNLPAGAVLDENRLTWTPRFDQGDRTYEIQLLVSDGINQVRIDVNVHVKNVDRAPEIRETDPARGIVFGASGETVRFSVTAVDPDGDELSFAWSINGVSVDETGPSLLVTIPATVADDVVEVVVSAGRNSVNRQWTVGKTLKGDFNGDGAVNFADFIAFAGAFGTASPAFDLDGSGLVDFQDFIVFATYFGLP